jgi:hypothetical protein
MANFPATGEAGTNKGMPAPAAYYSADGAIFWGMQQDGTARGYGYAVYRQDLRTGVTTLALFLPGGQGQLCVQQNGALWAVSCTASGDGKPVQAKTVPGFVVTPPESGDGSLSVRYATALERLCQFLGI